MSNVRPSIQILALAIIAAVTGSCVPAAPAGAPGVVPELVGRTAGPAQRCVPVELARPLRIVDERTVLYGSGRTIWVNRLPNACPGADRMDTLIAEPTGARYCNGDFIRLLDPATRIPGPVCVLGDFVPYSR